MIALQQRSPQGIPLGPHFFNHGDTQADRESRRISHLIHRATGLQIPGTPLPIHPYPCQDPMNHPDRTGTSRRPEGLNELIHSTSFGLTIYTVPYPQGHSGLQTNGNPLTSSPLLFHKEDLSPVYNLMHQSFSDNRLKSQDNIPLYHCTKRPSDGYRPHPLTRPPSTMGLRTRRGRCLDSMAKGDPHTTRTRQRIYTSPASSWRGIRQVKQP